MPAGPVKQLREAQRLIMAALADGRLVPTSAIRYARRAARGEDISVISQLAPVPGVQVSAASQSQLAAQIVDILTQLVTGEPAGPDEYAGLFPPQPGAAPQPRQTIYYESGDPTPHLVDDPNYPNPDGTSWDGYVTASGPLRGGLVEEPEELSDDEADTLYPPRTEAESRRHAATRQAMAEARAAAAWSDEELHNRLFGG